MSSPSDLWEMLLAQQSAYSTVPKNRFNDEAWYHPDPDRRGSINAPGGYFLGHDDNFQRFDPTFFRMTPGEAKALDPQRRKLLEVVYECFESAGATLESVAGSNTGCYVANFSSDIKMLRARYIEYIDGHESLVRCDPKCIGLFPEVPTEVDNRIWARRS